LAAGEGELMKLVERRFTCKTRSETFRLFVLGDVHVGALNCAENELRKVVRIIEADPNAYWIGGGDYCDAVILGDVKRFDVNTLPDWMLTGKAATVKARIGDILYAQRQRFYNIVNPIKHKCLGMIEGNHEYSIFKYHNRDHMNELCRLLSTDEHEVENLTDCAFLRLRFDRVCRRSKDDKRRKEQKPSTRTMTAIVFICHGQGGGRTSGAEPNKLFRLSADKDADIVLTGHTHTFCILPPLAMLTVPRDGKLPEDSIVREKHVANWGAYVYTYKAGPSTYASRANYPVRPMYTVETILEPHRSTSGRDKLVIRMNEVRL
jgi:predicted MPP superfamily phosphohydrolase